MSEPVWKELAELRRAGQTYDNILTEMIDLQKKQRLADDIRQSLEEDDLIPLQKTVHAKGKNGAAKGRVRIKVARTKGSDVLAA